MIHVGVQAIIEASFIILDIDRLGRSIHAVCILRFEQKNTQVRIFTHIGIPVILILASRHNFCRNRLFIVGCDLEVAPHAKGRRNTSERCVLKVNQDVV